MGVGPVVDQVHLAQVHGEGGGDLVVALDGRGQVLVIVVQVDKSGPDEAVHGVGIVFDLISGFYRREQTLIGKKLVGRSRARQLT